MYSKDNCSQCIEIKEYFDSEALSFFIISAKHQVLKNTEKKKHPMRQLKSNILTEKIQLSSKYMHSQKGHSGKTFLHFCTNYLKTICCTVCIH